MNSLFYRTYWKDYSWLKVSLQSLKRHAKGWDNTVVTIAQSGSDKADWDSLIKEYPAIDFRFVQEVCQNDYIGQQYTKMTADHYCPEGTVTFVDSDCVLFEDFSPSDMIEPDGRIIWLHTPYAEIPDGAVPWQAPTEAFMRRKVEHEFMRRHPMMIHTATMQLVRQLCTENHMVSLSSYLRRIERAGKASFSEFNVMGAVAYYNKGEHNRYRWVRPDKEVTRPFMKQFWSWGGIDKAQEELARMGYQV